MRSLINVSKIIIITSVRDYKYSLIDIILHLNHPIRCRTENFSNALEDQLYLFKFALLHQKLD